MKRSFTVRRLTEKRAKSSLVCLSQSQHWARHARTCTETHTLQCSAEGSGTSRRQHPVPTGCLLCDKGQFGFSLARLPAWDLNASLTDMWPQVFVFCFGNVSPFFPLSSSSAPLLPLCSFFFFTLPQVVCRGCPGNLAGCPDNLHPPSPPHSPTAILSGGTSELAVISH